MLSCPYAPDCWPKNDCWLCRKYEEIYSEMEAAAAAGAANAAGGPPTIVQAFQSNPDYR
jgi:hypothetical protein